MKTVLEWNGGIYETDLEAPLDIGLALKPGLENPNCFYAPPFEVAAVEAGDFVGDTRKGGVVNFFNVRLNPHGNGTHTECMGHISLERQSINASLRVFHYFARLISVYPMKMENGDRVIQKDQLVSILSPEVDTPAIIIRTLPNDHYKSTTNYSGANPPYFSECAIDYLVEKNCQHLLVDLPSVDREEDEGKLLAHKAFWKFNKEQRLSATITELIYVPETIKDGLYLLNIQIAAFELDASPSKPILYELKEL